MPIRVLRYPTAGSHHSYGVDSITRRFRADVPISLKMVNAPSTPRLCCCSFLSRERGATVACQKSGIYPRFDSAAGLGQIPLIPGQIPYLILRVTGLDSASGPIPGNVEHWMTLFSWTTSVNCELTAQLILLDTFGRNRHVRYSCQSSVSIDTLRHHFPTLPRHTPTRAGPI